MAVNRLLRLCGVAFVAEVVISILVGGGTPDWGARVTSVALFGPLRRWTTRSSATVPAKEENDE